MLFVLGILDGLSRVWMFHFPVLRGVPFGSKAPFEMSEKVPLRMLLCSLEFEEIKLNQSIFTCSLWHIN